MLKCPFWLVTHWIFLKGLSNSRFTQFLWWLSCWFAFFSHLLLEFSMRLGHLSYFFHRHGLVNYFLHAVVYESIRLELLFQAGFQLERNGSSTAQKGRPGLWFPPGQPKLKEVWKIDKIVVRVSLQIQLLIESWNSRERWSNKKGIVSLFEEIGKAKKQAPKV